MNLLALVLVPLFTFVGQQNAADGSISGTLRNAAGAPLAGVRVAAMAVPGVDTPPNEAAALVSLTQTDESGRYRLANISPGRYYITAGLVYAPTFYPGAPAPSATSIVTVSAGAVLTGYDFRTVISSGVTVKGRLAAGGMTSVRPPTVALRGRSLLAGGQPMETSVAPDGSFQFQRVPSGTYQVVAFPPSFGVSLTTPEVIVRNEDISDVLLVPVPQSIIPIRIVSDDGNPLPTLSWTVTARAPGRTNSVGGYALIFVLPDGSYQVSLNGVPPGYAVKSIKYGNMDISATGMMKTDASSTQQELVFAIAAVTAPGATLP